MAGQQHPRGLGHPVRRLQGPHATRTGSSTWKRSATPPTTRLVAAWPMSSWAASRATTLGHARLQGRPRGQPGPSEAALRPPPPRQDHQPYREKLRGGTPGGPRSYPGSGRRKSLSSLSSLSSGAQANAGGASGRASTNATSWSVTGRSGPPARRLSGTARPPSWHDSGLRSYRQNGT